MKVRDLFLTGAVLAGLTSAPALAADTGPLPAAGPAAQSEGGVLGLDNWIWYAGLGAVGVITAVVLSSDSSTSATHT